MSCLRYLCLLANYSGIQHMLPVSLDCPFLIAPSVFSNIYLQFLNNVIICEDYGIGNLSRFCLPV